MFCATINSQKKLLDNSSEVDEPVPLEIPLGGMSDTNPWPAMFKDIVVMLQDLQEESFVPS